ncbi:unnamed protein product, partial [Meganyctiphanes norvegica]
MNFYKEISPSQPEPLDLPQQGKVNNSSTKAMDSYSQSQPPRAFPQPHGLVRHPDPPDLSRHAIVNNSGQFSQHGIVNNSAPRARSLLNQANRHGAFLQPHGLVHSQLPRTFIPPRPPYLSTAPRGPANLALTRPVHNDMNKLVNNSQNFASSWVVTAKDFLKYKALFQKADTNKDGYVTGIEVRDMFIRTGLTQKNLIHIWDLVDTKQEGKLNCEQFALAMWFTMRAAVHKMEPPNKLNPEMIPPSMRVKAPPVPVPNVMQYRTNEAFPKPTNNRINGNASKVMAKPSMVTIPRGTISAEMMQPAMRAKAPVANVMQYKNKETFPKPTNKVTAKKYKPARPPKEDHFGCPNCLMMYDDSQYSPRKLPCGHTFCIDCIDETLNNDNVKCGICGVDHKTLAAADFPVNVVIEELIRKSLEEKSEEERKKFIHDADNCYFCFSDGPPMKRIKVGHTKDTCDIESSQENNSSVGCQMVKTDDKLGNTDNINAGRNICNENNLVVGNEVSKMGGKSGNTENANKIDTCNKSENNLNSLSVLEKDSQCKEKMLSTRLQTNCEDALDSNKQNLKQNCHNIEENCVENIFSNENTIDNKLPTILNVISNYSETNETSNKLETNLSDRLSPDVMFTENFEKSPINSELTKHQRLTPNKSKIDENMNSLSVDKFLEEILK